MINYDVRSYLKIVKSAIPKELCEKTVSQLENIQEWNKHGFTSPIESGMKSYDDDFYVRVGNIVSTHDEIVQCLWNSTFEYLTTLDFDWYTEWAGFSQLKFNKYVPGTRMRNHCDHITSIFDGQWKGIPTLTLLCQLNDSYEGGELFFWEDVEVKLEVGDIVVFPSNFLYPHKVDTVTSGTRYSLASWVI